MMDIWQRITIGLSIFILAMCFVMCGYIQGAQAQTFNQCANPITDCDFNSLDIIAGTIDPGETFETHFDVQGPISINRCAWSWEATYDPLLVTPTTFALTYSELFAVVNCATTTTTPPIGFPTHTALFFCDVIDPNVLDAFPPSFAPTFTDIVVTWEVQTGSLSGSSEQTTIRAGDSIYFQELIIGQCNLAQGPDPMDTDIRVTVPEPNSVSGLLAGTLFIGFLVRRK
jgi:hypothetical protein